MKKHFTILILLISHLFAFNGQPISNIKFNYLDINDGLSNNDINCIEKDTSGFIWIGTENGLNRFDGYDVKRFFFNDDDSTSLPSNQISKIYVSKNGEIWIATYGAGLVRYNPEYEIFERFSSAEGDSNKLQSKYLRDIVEDVGGNLWLATDGAGVARFDVEKRTYKHYRVNPSNLENSLNYDDVEKLMFQNDSLLLIGTDVGLEILNINTGKVKKT